MGSSSALEYSSRLPVSVYGTDTTVINSVEAFLEAEDQSVCRGLASLFTSRRCTSVCPYRVLPVPPTGLNQTIHNLADLSFSVPSTKIIHGGSGILT